MSTSQKNESITATLATERLRQCTDAELLDAWTHDRLSIAFAVLVERYGRIVLAVCRRKCCSPTDADDAYQTTFLLLAKNSAKISRPECLPGWLHRVAQRASIATLTRKTESPDEPIDLAMDDDPLDRISQQHDAIVLDEELSALPEHYRAALVMHVYQDCPLERMAEHFQTTLGSIRGRLQRGKKLLASRLRRRGIVPVLAVAAAGSSVITAADASAASASVMQALGDGPTPSPPIPENLLNPLVTTGRRIMTPWNTIGGVAAVGTIAAVLMTPGFGSDEGGRTGDNARTVPLSIQADQEPIVAQFSSPGLVATNDQSGSKSPAPSGAATANDSSPGGAAPTKKTVPSGASVGLGGMGGLERAKPAGDGTTVLKRRFRAVTPTGPLAESLTEKMDESVEIQIEGSVESLVRELESQLDLPVMLSDRVIEYAKLDPNQPITFNGRSQPLRTALRKLLRPLGLKATIETDGLVLTADHSELVHHGVGTDQWLNVNDKLMREIVEKLSQPISLTLIETPISEAVSVLSDQLDLPIMVDQRSLEAIGLDQDAGVNIDLNGIAAYDLIAIMLSDLELTLSVHNNILTVMTLEAAEGRLLTRVYWLEGIGLGGDFDSLMALIETTVTPDTWEALGGASTIGLVPGKRPGLVVNSTFDVHREIEQLIKALRENSFALDAIAEDVEVPSPPAANRGYGQGFGGEGGFGGGMGGFM